MLKTRPGVSPKKPDLTITSSNQLTPTECWRYWRRSSGLLGRSAAIPKYRTGANQPISVPQQEVPVGETVLRAPGPAIVDYSKRSPQISLPNCTADRLLLF